jgi:hypothetical protein
VHEGTKGVAVVREQRTFERFEERDDASGGVIGQPLLGHRSRAEERLLTQMLESICSSVMSASARTFSGASMATTVVAGSIVPCPST